MRAIGIDYGEARIGVAGSDTLGMLAHPVETIDRRKVADPIGRIAEIARERGAEVVVVGMPLRMDGSRGTAAEAVAKFINRLRRALPESMRIEELDERLSTVAAQAQLHASGRNVKNSRGVIDQAAAAVILQDYLNTSKGPEAFLLDDEDEDGEE